MNPVLLGWSQLCYRNTSLLWYPVRDSNPRQTRYEHVVLTTELTGYVWCPQRESNSHGLRPTDFKSVMSTIPSQGLVGAGTRNRTEVFGLEGDCNTIILYPHGWDGGARTPDKMINSHLLYRLSYIPNLVLSGRLEPPAIILYPL